MASERRGRHRPVITFRRLVVVVSHPSPCQSTITSRRVGGSASLRASISTDARQTATRPGHRASIALSALSHLGAVERVRDNRRRPAGTCRHAVNSSLPLVPPAGAHRLRVPFSRPSEQSPHHLQCASRPRNFFARLFFGLRSSYIDGRIGWASALVRSFMQVSDTPLARPASGAGK